MRVLQVHNDYGIFSGEEAMVESVARLLENKGQEVRFLRRSSAEIPGMLFGRTRAFLSGIYSASARRDARAFLREYRPDVVHIHNLYPFLSPWILRDFRTAGVPIVMTLHNYRLVCPNGLCLSHHEVCERCAGGREYWCVLRNCEGNPAKSLGYALRNWVARRARLYLDNVTLYTSPTLFLRDWLAKWDVPVDRIRILPNMNSIEGKTGTECLGDYVAFVGRLSPEKGVDVLLQSARQCPEIEFRVAGDDACAGDLKRCAPGNVRFLGKLGRDELQVFYSNARMVVAPSLFYEGFPLVIVEAMVKGRPVVCSRIGGLPEIVEEGKTGLCFTPGDVSELASAIRRLWQDASLCRRLGEAGRVKALRNYAPERYYDSLMRIYQEAIEGTPPRQG
jgi:glycosyltransferase involved in cell wall biosynthesis